MDHYTPERLILEAHRTMARVAEERSRLVPESERMPFRGPIRSPIRSWMAGRLRMLADRLDGRPAAHLRVVR